MTDGCVTGIMGVSSQCFGVQRQRSNIQYSIFSTWPTPPSARPNSALLKILATRNVWYAKSTSAWRISLERSTLNHPWYVQYPHRGGISSYPSDQMNIDQLITFKVSYITLSIQSPDVSVENGHLRHLYIWGLVPRCFY